MSEPQKQTSVKDMLQVEGGYLPQEAMLEVTRKSGSIKIGIPQETTLQENRVALVPASVATLSAYGHRVILEQDSGRRTGYSDHYYSEAGAEIAFDNKRVYEEADVILKTSPPTMEELELMHPEQTLISPLQLPLVKDSYLYKLKEKRVLAMAMEYVQDEEGSYPLLRIMGEIAGSCAMTIASELLSKSQQHGKGILLGNVSGVPPARVVIIGAGAVAQAAVRVALGMGAEVRVFDDNVMKLMRLQADVGQRLNTSTLNPYQLKKELLTADIAIGAFHSTSGRSPVLVSEETVSRMKAGSVIMDVSIDQGGCFATSEVTTHNDPVFIKHDVIHYCVPNIASRVPRTASIAVSNILTPLLIKAGNCGGLDNLIRNQHHIRRGIYAYKGKLTNAYLAQRFGMSFTDLNLLMTPGI